LLASFASRHTEVATLNCRINQEGRLKTWHCTWIFPNPQQQAFDSPCRKWSAMLASICYPSFMQTVKVAYAKANLPKLLARVARGERIIISRYNTPMAELVPPSNVPTVKRKFGTGKGRATLIDPHALDPMTEKEAEAFLKGIY
jgi:prevent-host-death family protein